MTDHPPIEASEAPPPEPLTFENALHIAARVYQDQDMSHRTLDSRVCRAIAETLMLGHGIDVSRDDRKESGTYATGEKWILGSQPKTRPGRTQE